MLTGMRGLDVLFRDVDPLKVGPVEGMGSDGSRVIEVQDRYDQRVECG